MKRHVLLIAICCLVSPVSTRAQDMTSFLNHIVDEYRTKGLKLSAQIIPSTEMGLLFNRLTQASFDCRAEDLSEVYTFDVPESWAYRLKEYQLTDIHVWDKKFIKSIHKKRSIKDWSTWRQISYPVILDDKAFLYVRMKGAEELHYYTFEQERWKKICTALLKIE